MRVVQWNSKQRTVGGNVWDGRSRIRWPDSLTHLQENKRNGGKLPCMVLLVYGTT